jgi:PAS domain S-box-containing protein
LSSNFLEKGDVMAKKPDGPTKLTGLRHQAEELLRTTKRDVAAMPVKNVQRLVHELQVHQIELEMQNDELRRTQMELEAARDRYVDLYDFSPVGHLTLDTHGTIVEANLRVGMMLGINRKELIGQSVARFFALEDQDIFHRHCQEVLKAGTRQSCEVHLRKKAGASSCVYLESLVDHDELGHITDWRMALLDITERKRAEEELRESEARLRAILDNSPGMVFLKDAEGRYLHVNRQFGIVFHLTRDQVVGKTDEAIFVPEQAAAFRANDLKVFQAGVPIEFEEVAMHDDGPHTSIVSKFLLYGGDGKPYALCGITTEITDRKRVEIALRQSEERYRSIFENAVEGIFQTTLDGKYVAVNPALARMYGYDSPDDMIATITDIASQLYVDPGRRDEFIRLIEAQGEVTGFETLVYRKDGSIIWISENVRTRRDQAGMLVGYEGTVEHVTERKLAEERLRATLEEVRMLSGRITTVQEAERTRIARELHDELGVGLTCLKIDLSRLYTMVNEEAEAGAPKKAADKIRSMVEQIDTTIASVQRLVTELRPAVLDDLGLVAAVEWQCQDFQKRTGIPCTCVTSADDIAMEPERATALFRICQEALTNTARHAQATAVTIKLESRSDFLQLVVADNGVGIPDTKVLNRRSLGLLGMRERVALFGGEITFQGNPGKGTTVTACLPRCLS